MRHPAQNSTRKKTDHLLIDVIIAHQNISAADCQQSCRGNRGRHRRSNIKLTEPAQYSTSVESRWDRSSRRCFAGISSY
jgi:hypothetical protein